MSVKNSKPILTLGSRKIGLGEKPFIIAEMSGNHNQSLERALRLIDEAAKAGADAVKFQTYTANTMTIDHDSDDFLIKDKKSLWQGEKLYDLYKKAMTPWEWHKPLFEHCNKRGLVAFSTPFDETSVDFLESLNAPFYKIASFENTDLPLIRKIASTGKPIIMSTGMTTREELDEAVNTARLAGCKDLILLKCTSTYPAEPVNSNLNTIPDLRKSFQCEVGLSDHTLGIGAAIASIALGATVIEKHFTLSRNEGGVDAAFSMEPQELKLLCEESTRAWQALGEIQYGPTEAEKSSLRFRRSLYIVEDMKTGDVITEKNVRRIRPSFGIEPRFYDSVLGKTVLKDVKRGTPLTWDVIKK